MGVIQMDYLNGYKEYLEETNKSPKTISSYCTDIKLFLEWYSDQTRHDIVTLTQRELNEYKKDLEAPEPKKIKTINRKITSVNSFLQWMKNNGHIEKELKLDTVKDDTPLTFKALDIPMVKRLEKEIDVVGNKMHICLFQLLKNTGLRVSEICDLELSNIQMSERKGSIMVKGKGNKYRTIPLNQEAREAISEYLIERTNYLQDRPKLRHVTKLLVGQRGALGRNAVDVILKQYGDKLGINVSAHMLRHHVGYQLVSKNKPITTIQKILGHSSIQTTAIYTQTQYKDMEDALEDLN